MTRRNFGSGSSREHAVWALENFGFRAILAPSFADIFFNNCFKNGVLPVTLDEATIDDLFTRVCATRGYELTVDLEHNRVRDSQGLSVPFTIEEARRERLLHGLDDIAISLQHVDRIAAYEAGHGIR